MKEFFDTLENINSKDLCNMINVFREKEGNKAKLGHDKLLRSIKNEIDSLLKSGIDTSDMFVLDVYHDNYGRQQPCYIIKKEGLKLLMDNEKRDKKALCYLYYNFFKKEDIEFIYLNKRKETNFIEKLEKTLKQLNISTGKCQYYVNIDGHRNYIDYYISELSIAIEYDENDHKGYSYKTHERRQKHIEEKLNCTFIRVSDKNDEDYNINYVIKNIYLYGKFPKKPIRIKYRRNTYDI